MCVIKKPQYRGEKRSSMGCSAIGKNGKTFSCNVFANMIAVKPINNINFLLIIIALSHVLFLDTDG
jgi:hypothetical protein